MEVMIDTNGVLSCPSCGCEYLHQGRIAVYHNADDGRSEAKLTVCEDKTTHNRAGFIGKNPSPRRDGMLIEFDCEQCDGEPTLAIYQHKGNTIVEWYSVRETKRVSIR